VVEKRRQSPTERRREEGRDRERRKREIVRRGENDV
jgi:hypothetical protein